MWYFVAPQQVGWMVALTVLGAIAYGPTSPIVWAMYADVADYSEWKNNRNTTSIVFATICFALKAGLGVGSFMVLQLLDMYGYESGATQNAEALHGIRLLASVYPTVLFLICTLLLAAYGINKRLTLQIASDLAGRRREAAIT
jgi:GPH family glycoside/pentoside/hexuronide:cation symporter